MFSIEAVRGRIGEFQQIAGQGREDAALDVLANFICDLIQDDSGLFLFKTSSDGLFALPARDGDPRLFLRVFSHEDIPSSIPAGVRLEHLSSIDVLRYFKWAFLCGAYGIILNEGDTWAAVSIPDVLRVFLSRAFPDESVYSPEFVDSVNIVSSARQNGAYHLVCAISNGAPFVAVNGSKKSYIVPHTDGVPDIADAEWLPVDAQTLFFVGDEVCATIMGQQLRVSGQSIRDVLEICGIRQERDCYSQMKIFYSEPIGITSASFPLDKIKDLSLSFPATNEPADASGSPEIPPVPATPDVEPSVPESSPQETLVQEKPQAHGIKAILMRVTESVSGAGPEPGRDEIAPLAPEISENRESEEVSEDDKEVAEEEEGPEKKRSFLPAVAACVLLALIVVGVVVGRVVYAERSAMARFRNFVESGNYAEAFYVYTESSLGQSADEVISKEINLVTKRYVAGELSDNEFASKMGVFSLFPNQEQSLSGAYATADIIKESRKAYELGNSADTVYDRLRYWSKISPLDETNYKTAQSEFEKNRAEWREVFSSRLELFADIDRERAKEILSVALQYYPDDAEFARYSEWFREDDARPALSRYPLHIEELTVKDAPETNSVSLYIRWSNSSGKAISSVDFYFVFLDENNARVTYWSDTGEVSIFRGEESSEGPYEPGFSVDSDTWGWTELWTNNGSRVAKVKLTAVNIWYPDGDTASFVTETDLNRLF